MVKKPANSIISANKILSQNCFMIFIISTFHVISLTKYSVIYRKSKKSAVNISTAIPEKIATASHFPRSFMELLYDMAYGSLNRAFSFQTCDTINQGTFCSNGLRGIHLKGNAHPGYHSAITFGLFSLYIPNFLAR
jgi:hypothetical protein